MESASPVRSADPALSRLFSWSLVRRNGLVAVCVGTLLTAVNQSDRILSESVDLPLILRIGANYLIPFTVACLGALLNRRP